MINIEAFSEVDIRIGKIVAVVSHEKARKPMYRLTVDFGADIGKRNIIAGIKGYYLEADLINKKVACVVNLNPKVIAGVESEGMILAAGEGEAVALLVPDKDITEGSRVH
ncbi:MAG: tRNA-binding protein [Candidatus Micrarchaeaceae archaeon]